MSIQLDALLSEHAELERQFMHLLALRRALSVLKAKRGRPHGSRRRIRDSKVMRACAKDSLTRSNAWSWPSSLWS